MLEIIVLIKLCQKIGENARAKGRAAGWYQFMLVAFWFGGEVGVALAGGIIMGLVFGEDGDDGVFCFMYLLAIGGAILGALLAFQIVASLPEPDREPRDDIERWRDDDDRDDLTDRYGR